MAVRAVLVQAGAVGVAVRGVVVGDTRVVAVSVRVAARVAVRNPLPRVPRSHRVSRKVLMAGKGKISATIPIMAPDIIPARTQVPCRHPRNIQWHTMTMLRGRNRRVWIRRLRSRHIGKAPLSQRLIPANTRTMTDTGTGKGCQPGRLPSKL